ncbi:translation machinery-associated protein 22-like protein [Tanacetum coccineum]
MAEKPQPVQVLYCGVCGLPAEYCEFGPDFEKCKPWLIQYSPQTYPDLQGANVKDVDGVTNQLQSASITDGVSGSVMTDGYDLEGVRYCLLNSLLLFDTPDKQFGNAYPNCSSAPKQEPVKRLPGGKVKKKEKQEVIIEKVTRNKRKSITTLKGLELFGVKLSDASKKLGKKFATGASVVKGPTEKDQIDVQGDIAYDIVDFITHTWPDVPETAIYFIEDGKKVPAV